MQVRTRGKSGGADKTDNFLLLHLLADLEAFGEAGQVKIARLEPACVLDRNGVARPPHHLGLHHLAARWRPHRRPNRRRVVDTEVSPHRVQNGMEALEVEFGADANVAQRRLEHALGKGLTLFIIVVPTAALAAWIPVETAEGPGLAAVFGGEQLAILVELPAQVLLLD